MQSKENVISPEKLDELREKFVKLTNDTITALNNYANLKRQSRIGLFNGFFVREHRCRRDVAIQALTRYLLEDDIEKPNGENLKALKKGLLNETIKDVAHMNKVSPSTVDGLLNIIEQHKNMQKQISTPVASTQP